MCRLAFAKTAHTKHRSRSHHRPWFHLWHRLGQIAASNQVQPIDSARKATARLQWLGWRRRRWCVGHWIFTLWPTLVRGGRNIEKRLIQNGCLQLVLWIERTNRRSRRFAHLHIYKWLDRLWLVTIRVSKRNKRIVAVLAVLTREHCPFFHPGGPLIWQKDGIQFGVHRGNHYGRYKVHDNDRSSATYETSIEVTPSGQHIYPGYLRNGLIYDIGLVKLPHPIKFSHSIQPVKLPQDCVGLGDDEDVDALGIGYSLCDQNWSEVDGKLREASFKTVACNSSQQMREDSGDVQDSLICTLQENGKITAGGDSGELKNERGVSLNRSNRQALLIFPSRWSIDPAQRRHTIRRAQRPP